MLRVAWRTLSSIRTQAVTWAPVLGLPGGGCSRLPSDHWGLRASPRGLSLPAARGYAIQKPVRPSQEDDPPPSTLLKDYQNIPGIENMANPEDTSALEARIVALTVKIRNYEEHMQKHRKDKTHKRYLLMSIDRRKKMLKNLRKTNYNVFEKTCKELGIEYTFPPLYHRKAHRRWVTKKALCIQVFQEAQKLKKQKRALKAAAAAKKQGQTNPQSPSKAGPEAIKKNQ
ncbi:28S ribosomal protein S15, mitochondrial [Pteropus vampyrus]|uniref:Small ribosomal subunit protein uS15m n=1 Tax=Pteropus vampyrus TaxID=132908 RepID=A0A6P3PYV7_PTEVA|nr:28S ribosomal protein S15, mitochondrial [Pteropus vampyrus]